MFGQINYFLCTLNAFIINVYFVFVLILCFNNNNNNIPSQRTIHSRKGIYIVSFSDVLIIGSVSLSTISCDYKITFLMVIIIEKMVIFIEKIRYQKVDLISDRYWLSVYIYIIYQTIGKISYQYIISKFIVLL